MHRFGSNLQVFNPSVGKKQICFMFFCFCEIPWSHIHIYHGILANAIEISISLFLFQLRLGLWWGHQVRHMLESGRKPCWTLVTRCREKGENTQMKLEPLLQKQQNTFGYFTSKWLNKRNPYHKLSIQDTFTRSTLVEHSFSSFPCCMSSTCRGIGGLWYHIETNRKAKLHQES